MQHMDKKLKIEIALLSLLGLTIVVSGIARSFIDASERHEQQMAEQAAKESDIKTPDESQPEPSQGIRMISGRIAVHEYEDITITEDNPLMGFNNPIENEDIALLRYMVDADYKSENPVSLIQEEMWIRPGKTLPIDVYAQLDPGVYSVRISILAMDPVTDEELGADVQHITITVE